MPGAETADKDAVVFIQTGKIGSCLAFVLSQSVLRVALLMTTAAQQLDKQPKQALAAEGLGGLAEFQIAVQQWSTKAVAAVQSWYHMQGVLWP